MKGLPASSLRRGIKKGMRKKKIAKFYDILLHCFCSDTEKKVKGKISKLEHLGEQRGAVIMT